MYRRFDPSRSLLAGMDTSILQARLAQMQQDLLDLQSGRKLQSASYTQGDGGKSVSFTLTNIGGLVQMIQLVQAQLGLRPRVRSPINVRF